MDPTAPGAPDGGDQARLASAMRLTDQTVPVAAAHDVRAFFAAHARSAATFCGRFEDHVVVAVGAADLKLAADALDAGLRQGHIAADSLLVRSLAVAAAAGQTQLAPTVQTALVSGFALALQAGTEPAVAQQEAFYNLALALIVEAYGQDGALAADIRKVNDALTRRGAQIQAHAAKDERQRVVQEAKGIITDCLHQYNDAVARARQNGDYLPAHGILQAFLAQAAVITADGLWGDGALNGVGGALAAASAGGGSATTNRLPGQSDVCERYAQALTVLTVGRACELRIDLLAAARSRVNPVIVLAPVDGELGRPRSDQAGIVNVLRVICELEQGDGVTVRIDRLWAPAAPVTERFRRARLRFAARTEAAKFLAAITTPVTQLPMMAPPGLITPLPGHYVVETLSVPGPKREAAYGAVSGPGLPPAYGGGFRSRLRRRVSEVHPRIEHLEGTVSTRLGGMAACEKRYRTQNPATRAVMVLAVGLVRRTEGRGRVQWMPSGGPLGGSFGATYRPGVQLVIEADQVTALDEAANIPAFAQAHAELFALLAKEANQDGGQAAIDVSPQGLMAAETALAAALESLRVQRVKVLAGLPAPGTPAGGPMTLRVPLVAAESGAYVLEPQGVEWSRAGRFGARKGLPSGMPVSGQGTGKTGALSLGPTLLAEPLVVEELASGQLKAGYALDGQHLLFRCGKRGFRFNDFLVRLHTSPEGRVLGFDLDVLNMPFGALTLVGQVIGLPPNLLQKVQSDETMAVRFALRQGLLFDFLQPAFESSRSLLELLDARDAAGLPLIFDLGNYLIDGVLLA